MFTPQNCANMGLKRKEGLKFERKEGLKSPVLVADSAKTPRTFGGMHIRKIPTLGAGEISASGFGGKNMKRGKRKKGKCEGKREKTKDEREK